MTDKRSDRDPRSRLAAAGSSGQGSAQGGQTEATETASADMQALIGRQLRAVYDDIAKQPVPDRFVELMRQLDKQSASG